MEPADLMPLEDKIFTHFNEEPYFTYAQVEERFPDEHPRALYRAINKLEETQRIRFIRYLGKRKAYTTAGVSQLPMLKNKEGETYPLSKPLKYMAELHDEGGRLKELDEINDMFIVMMQLFTIAQIDDAKDRQRQSIQAYKRLLDMRQWLLRWAANIDSVIKHPAMQGEPEIFKRVFNSTKDKEVPSAEELLEFRRWLAQVKGKD